MRYWDGTAWGEMRGPKRSLKKLWWVAAVLAVLAGVYLIGSPYLTVYRMKSAAERHDGPGLSEFIEFPSVRQSLKDQLNAHLANEMASDPDMADNPFSAIGTALAGTLAEKMVDAYVTPAGISRLMSGASLSDKGDSSSYGSNPLDGASMGYQSFDRFAITVKDDQGENIEFVLRRRGIGWKLTDLVMPKN